MKVFFTIITLFTVTFCLKAQEQFVKGKHYTDADLNKFAGRWVGKDGSTTFEIVLKNEKTFIKGADIYMDMIRGKYTLSKDGKIISRTSNDTTINTGHFIDKGKSLTAITLYFTDLDRKSKHCIATFELVDNDRNKGKWILKNTEHIVVGNDYFDPTFSVPTTMTLTRVK